MEIDYRRLYLENVPMHKIANQVKIYGTYLTGLKPISCEKTNDNYGTWLLTFNFDIGRVKIFLYIKILVLN